MGGCDRALQAPTRLLDGSNLKRKPGGIPGGAGPQVRELPGLVA